MSKENQEILESRAHLMREKLSEVCFDEWIPIIEFVLAPEHYAFEVAYVREVLTLKDLTHIPGTPAHVAGVINYRGNMLAVNNLKVLLGLKERGLTELNKIIVLRDDHMEYGILCDAIIGNHTIDPKTISALPPTVSGAGAGFTTGVSNEGLILLNAGVMLKSEILTVNQK
jgi:purine-binding chemotaxis protein CheW